MPGGYHCCNSCGAVTPDEEQPRRPDLRDPTDYCGACGDTGCIVTWDTAEAVEAWKRYGCEAAEKVDKRRAERAEVG